MLDVSPVLGNPDLVQTFMVFRSSGQFALGGWQENTPTQIPMQGVVTIADTETLEMMPEGDRVTGAMTFYSTSEVFRTHNDSQAGTSDYIQWRGQNYRVMHVWPYADYGYWKALAVRMAGD